MTRPVLVVDDSLTVRMDLVEAFEAVGIESIGAASLSEARAALARHDIGLAILDVLLPDGDGVAFLAELRAMPGRADLPVLMLSSEAEVKDRVRGLRTGANEYVGKPYETRYVVSRARQLLGHGRRQPARRETVLVIDDSETFRQALGAALEDAGYAVVLAEDGRSGLAAIADRRPDAVLVDGIMPDMDGAALIRRVRLDAATRHLPCLLLTASDDAGAQLRALEAGADAFVRKDGDMELILARLVAILRRPAAPALEQVGGLAAHRKILAVDDSLTYLNELHDALRGEGYEVSLARSGEEALELLAVQPVDCILMDLVMPGIGGKEACERIKAAPGVRDIPLILLTAHDDRTAMLAGLGAGADDYISKSAEFAVLFARMRAQIRRKQFEDENRRFREELLGRELEASEERSARQLAEARAAMVDELERKIEERTRELEANIAERRHAERLASLGMLSASIAHEINNPLTVVSGNLDLVMLLLDDLRGEAAFRTAALPPESLHDLVLARLKTTDEPLRDALEAAERVRDIVRDLRILARSPSDEALGAVDVHSVIESALRMASNEVRHRARVVRDFGTVPKVRGNDSRLGQVFINLVVNAAHALQLGGLERNEIRIGTAFEPALGVIVEVADNGIGIAEEKLARLFEPFFTTKPAGVGTGLGLAICQRIVGELGGSISVSSTLGVGTCFRVVLKPADATVDIRPASPLLLVSGQRRGRILVVDDEPALCKTIERLLAGEHEVLALTSARAALALLDRGERFDVIVSDLMMPEMTGMELHDRIAVLSRSQAERVLFMTGGAFSPDAAAFIQSRPGRLLEKPFRPAALRSLLQDMLSRPSAVA